MKLKAPYNKIVVMVAPERVKDALPTPGAAEKPRSPQAERALREAALRRAAIDARACEASREPEHQGRGGLEPVRYDDWEVRGLASDF